jgi:hypothetical protein
MPCGLLAVGLVGRNVQPLERLNLVPRLADQKQRDADGNIVVMDDPALTLKLLSWKDERSPWQQENYRITSVTKR